MVEWQNEWWKRQITDQEVTRKSIDHNLRPFYRHLFAYLSVIGVTFSHVMIEQTINGVWWITFNRSRHLTAKIYDYRMWSCICIRYFFFLRILHASKKGEENTCPGQIFDVKSKIRSVWREDPAFSPRIRNYVECKVSLEMLYLDLGW